VIEVLEVYLDDEEWESVSYEEVKDSANSSENIFSQIGRFIYFPIDLAATAEICKIRVKRNFSFVDMTLDDEAEVDLPESYRQLLISGSLISLTSRGKYKDEGVYKVNKEVFEREFVSLKAQYENLEIITNYGLKYAY